MAELFMMATFVSSIVGTLYFSGTGTVRDFNDIKSKVSQVKQQTDDIKTSLSQINKKNLEIDNNIKNNITNAIKQHQRLSSELILANQNYTLKLKGIQLIGIIIIGTIGLLFIIKRTGILKDLFKKDNSSTNISKI